MSTTARRALQLSVSLVVGAACLWLAFRGVLSTDADTGVSWERIGAAITSTALWGPLVYVLSSFVQFALRTERWRVQVRGLSGQAPGLRESLAINAVGFAAVFLLPFRLGEFVRPNLAKHRGLLSASAGMAQSAVERVVDGIVTTGFFGGVLLFMRMSMGDRALPDAVRVGGFTALFVFGGALVFFVVAFLFREPTTRVVERLLGLVHAGLAARVGRLVRGFIDGLACLRRPSDMARYLGFTVAYWVLNALTMWTLLVAMHVDAHVDNAVVAAFLCLCFLVIGVMIPAPPGNVGNFHAFARMALSIFAVPDVLGIAYAIVLHALTVAAVVLWAALFLASGDVSVARLKESAEAG